MKITQDVESSQDNSQKEIGDSQEKYTSCWNLLKTVKENTQEKEHVVASQQKYTVF